MGILSVRNDLDEHLPAVFEITGFAGRLDSGASYSGEVVSGGFGLPHVILTVQTSSRRIELALIESDDDDYEQDGTDPLQVVGWTYRIDADPDSMLGEGWQDDDIHTHYPSADAAYAVAIQFHEATA